MQPKRHWSFIACDKKYLYPTAIILLLVGVWASLRSHDSSQIQRIGNFIIGVGVWMSLRFTLREGINRSKDLANASPTVPGSSQLNWSFFNQIAFSIGDAQLQIHGFILVIIGSVVGSYGDYILKFLTPASFHWRS